MMYAQTLFLDKYAQTLVNQHGNGGQDDALDHGKRENAQEQICVHAINGRVYTLAQIEDHIQVPTHTLYIERQND